MDKLTEIKEKLNVIYKEYKDNKSQLNGEKTKTAAKLIVEMTFSDNVNPSDVATELARFSADIVNIYFESLTKSVTIPLGVLDEVLKQWYSTDKDSKLSQHYVQKYVFAVSAIIKNTKDKSSKSTQLPRLVVFIAQFAVKSDKHRSKFQTLINNTMAGIFMLDYSNISKNSLANVWNATKSLYPDLSKAKYESFITEWAIKYGFITSTAPKELTSTDNKVKIEESVVAKEKASNAVQPPVKTESVSPTPKKEEPKAAVTNDAINEKKDKSKSAPDSVTVDTPGEKPMAVPESKNADASAKKPLASTDKKVSNNTSEATANEKAPVKKSAAQILYERLKRDMDKEQETIITALTDMLTPVGKAFESVQGEISKSRELGAENESLKAKVAELEKQLTEQRDRLQTANQSLITTRTENEELKSRISTLESQYSELDSKLNDAYAINSRESSLEAEKIRSELTKAFAFLYEDWLEYEFSDVSEDNYESLQAIIKKIFRSLERNGIDFKGNN